ncbi:unnamed protein product [Ceutorhynchus assimilis]|uniref:RING-type domain-containing protein n=1 Tax=Ceutorhynchus assimilis TaxID=467358 RepID=A0A9N9MRS4_9CUCU|nr:unnamed protein product [Ceutorhynchus assimilis]
MECPSRKKHCVRDLNEFFTCKLCHGYLVDATTLVDCLHTFCRGCILRHFENSKAQTQCPVCPALYKKKSQCFRSDKQLQALVYKSVPSLYLKETQRRDDFYRSTGIRAGSSCSDDSVIDKERDMIHATEEMSSQSVGDKSHQYFNQDDSISLSLEYYQATLDTTDTKKCTSDQLNARNNGQCNNNINSDKSSSDKPRVCDKRYLQCPAGVNMKHLQKFVRMKYGLSADHRVDIIYKGEVLPNDFSLMDVAYTFKWEKKKPLRFFYRIFTPLKIQPIKIVNTPTATGGKQLQIVPVTNVQPILKSPTPIIDIKETESEQLDKETLMANLQLQSKSKAMQLQAAKKMQQVPEKIVKDCIYEYEEPDQEEIKRFAEKRDREWALQKKLEEETKADHRDTYFPTKKRKKSKHSKTDSNGHKEKKRKPHGDKIHAEITNNDKSDLKLKVKITNGHKHKHHKIENNSEISHKEKLLQMRQVRHHKHGSGDEKPNQPIPTIKLPKSIVESTSEEPEAKRRKENPTTISENNNKPLPMESHQKPKPRIEPMIIKPETKPIPSVSRPMPQLPSKVAKKEATVKPVFELNQKTFLKTAGANTDKYSKDQKIGQGKVENNKTSMSNKVLPIGSITTNNKMLDRKIANLQQRCTIEPKNPAINGKITNNEKSKLINPKYPPGFTVSKIESGVKRPASQDDAEQDKRPSLEITLIPPASTKTSEAKVVNKRPPPGTIPLERIKNAVNLKSGISIIPKMPSHDNNTKTDNNGVLDLSKTKSMTENPQKSKTEPINGLNSMINRQINNMARPMSSPSGEPGKNMQLSNLQMLSKVATEHPTLNKGNPSNNKVRPQMPNLQTINKMPGMASPLRAAGMQRMPPKLNDIQQKFRPNNPQIRNMRPNQNQNIRNIPNPSLMLNRHQNMNQARLVVSSTNNSAENTAKKVSTPKSSPVSSGPSPVTSTTTTVNNKEVQSSGKAVILEQKVAEAKDISV